MSGNRPGTILIKCMEYFCHDLEAGNSKSRYFVVSWIGTFMNYSISELDLFIVINGRCFVKRLQVKDAESAQLPLRLIFQKFPCPLKFLLIAPVFNHDDLYCIFEQALITCCEIGNCFA